MSLVYISPFLSVLKWLIFAFNQFTDLELTDNSAELQFLTVSIASNPTSNNSHQLIIKSKYYKDIKMPYGLKLRVRLSF